MAAIFAAAPAQSSLACFLCYVRLKFAIVKKILSFIVWLLSSYVQLKKLYRQQCTTT